MSDPFPGYCANFASVVAVQRGDADAARQSKGFHDTLGVKAGVDAVKYRDAALVVFRDRLSHVKSFEAYGRDQVAVNGVCAVQEYLHAGDVTQAGKLLGAFHHVHQQGVLLQVDSVHACDEKRAPVGSIGEVAAQPAHIVHHRGDRCKVRMREGTELPFLFGLGQQLVVLHDRHTV